MRIGISTRLFLAVLATAGLAVVLVSAAARWNFERGFLGYLNEMAAEGMAEVVPRLEQAYAEHGSWDRLRDGPPQRWFKLLRPQPGREAPMDVVQRAQAEGPPRSDLTGAMVRLGLLDAQLQWVAGYRAVTPDMRRQAVRYQGRVVGWLVLAPFEQVADAGDERFQQGQNHATLATAVLALMLSALIAWWVSGALLEPVRRVARATHLLAAGHHEVRVQVPGRDEVGQLARDFNHLAHTLERNEALRREFVADVSHELRTPLAVLRGELEALEDGIRPLNQAAVASLQGEVQRLGELVDDLFELALSDAGALSYRMAPLDLDALLRRAADTHRARIEASGLHLELALPDEPLRLQGDESRLLQLLDNLLENSRRYTDAPGVVRIEARSVLEGLQVNVHDSAPGLPDELLPRLFERFFRAEGSRSRASGGAGLGLAICRNIAQAHGGRIAAHPSPLGGVWMEVVLPHKKVIA
ncbi:ATP-binding protein [Azohydromonas aeria]|uniref:ATP-binding protein n=1 Tax=Azohydromonas aeria TaxID=2590212 RepID=UPI0012F7A0D1|nr:ATP-binding protein [Azohydromonas aeria]